MKRLLLWAIAAQIAAADDNATITVEKAVKYQATAGNHRIELVLRQGPLVPGKHKIDDHKGKTPPTIDGVTIAGTADRLPDTDHRTYSQLQSIELKWDGKEVPVEARHYVGLLNLSLDPGQSLQFVPSPDGDALLIQATGGDGGESYLTSLVLRQDGNHKQYGAVDSESGLPPYPYEVAEYGEVTGNTVQVKTFNWLPTEKKDE